MADVKQAAEWMQEGRWVRRPMWMAGAKFGEHNGRCCLFYGAKKEPVEYMAFFTISDLRADDWEITK